MTIVLATVSLRTKKTPWYSIYVLSYVGKLTESS